MSRLVCLTLLLLCLAACAQHKPILTDQEYLKLGQKHMQEEEYKEARQAFEDLETNYPDSRYMAQARFAQAQAYFEEACSEDNSARCGEAALQYERFLRYHPRNDLADEAQYQLGLSYFNQRLTIDRDTGHTRRAIKEFIVLTQKYPHSPLLSKVKNKQAICLDELAEHEFYVGNFYFKQGEYEAASGRLRLLLLGYPDSKAAPRALFYLAEAHWQLGKRPEAKELFKLYLSKYPDHENASQAQQRIK